MSGKSTRQSPELKRQRFWWFEHQVLPDPELPASAKIVLYRIGDGFNDLQSDGRCWEGYESIAAAIGMSKGTVIAMVHRAEALGHIRVEWGKRGSGHSNQIWLNIKPQSAEVSAEIGKGQPADLSDEISDEIKGQAADLSDDPCDKIKGQPADGKGQPADMNQGIKPRHPFGVPLGEIPASAFGGPGPNGPPHGVAGKKKKKDRHRHGAGNGGAAPPGYDDAVPHWQEFASLRGTIWKRGWPSDGKPQRRQEDIDAWTAALAKGASPEAILAAAREWAATFENFNGGLNYLPTLALWLNDDGWKKKPPKYQAKVNGGGRRSKGGARRSRRGDGAAVLDELHEKLTERMRRKETMQ